MRCPACHRRLASAGSCLQHEIFDRGAAASLPASLPGHLVSTGWLGSGGGGQVFAVRDARGEALALKLGEVAMAPRFQREAEVLRSLGSPHTPQLFGTGEHLGRPWLLMEKLEGQSLAARMTEPAEPDVCLSLVRRIAESLAVVHARGWCHRDLKPENLWLRASGEIAVLDFGLAKPMTGAEAGAERMGTAHYMAPEQCVDAGSAAAPADVYALGVVLFELITGRPPFTGDAGALREAHVQRLPPTLAAMGLRWPSLEPLLAGALAKEPANRFQDASELLAALRTVRLDDVERQHAPAVSGPGVHARRIALLAVQSDRNVDQLLRPVLREGGLLASTSHGRYLFAFPEPPTVEASLAAAERTWQQLNEPSVLHVADVVVRAGATSLRVIGADVSNPRWWDDGQPAPHGPHRTPAALGYAPRSTATAHETKQAPLAGREALLEELTALLSKKDARVVLTGPAGIGKTRLLRALQQRLPGLPVFDDVDRLDPWPAHGVIAGRDPKLRANRRVVLGPLDTAASVELLRALLQPLEFVAEDLLLRLVALTHGVPGLLVELPEALRRTGALAPDPKTGEWRLALDAGQLASTPLLEQLSVNTLAGLPRDTADVARLCALISEGSAELLGPALKALPPDWSAASLDPRRALERLARSGLLTLDADTWRFTEGVVAEAIERSLSPLARRVLHHAAWSALSPLEAPTAAQRARRAQHAEAAQRHADAQRDFLVLAELADRERRDVDAEAWLSSALLIPSGAPNDRATWLWHRARARRRNQRFREARADLSLALGQTTDAASKVELWLETATVCDWNEDFEGSLAALERARTEAAPLTLTPTTEQRLELAGGRALVRQGQWEPAVACLLAVAARSPDAEVEVVARMLAASALAVLNRLEASEQQFDLAVACAHAAGDTVHLGVALSNRVLLWLKHDRLDKALEDLRESAGLARANGHPQNERWNSHNLATFLLWLDQPQEALPLAERAHALGRRFFGDALPPTATLLLARLRLQLSDPAGARELLAALPATLADSDARQVRLLQLSLGDETIEADWLALCQPDPALPPDEAIDLLVAAARRLGAAGHAHSATECVARARGLLPQASGPLWSRALASFEV